MVLPRLTIRELTVRAVWVPLGRPVATKVGTFVEWPLILAWASIVPVLRDLLDEL